MTAFTTTIDIASPPSRVWKVMRDVERWHEWTASIRSVELLDGGPLRVGSKVRVRQPGLPTAYWEVMSVEEERGFTWVSRAPGITVTAHHRIEPLPSGSRATLVLEFTGLLGPIFGRLTSGINRRYMGLEAQGLKQRSERGLP